ncbi:hypothetical protein BCL57_001330 [Agromyces flavus]|uniref:Uncharacterized protein n=1 Tax=Agromyces flavus TaxID=589382 RepID=A0A1H1ZMZ1_9MICO|nr:hypothetical protein [Agromyces flavus]MCP2367176.1 hypothetical protein [Agromyces flavus]GGI46251.1 hypothetical protein GCM10010932_13660 [Agromyces flavus]SDT35171.1 hypothetical protein SAMN04489721_3255 [Agromyces flavus]
MSGSYGTPGVPQPDPKQPVTSMDTEAAAAAARTDPEAADARSMAASRAGARRKDGGADAPTEGTGS